MPLPPENVPLGLTAREYERLHILYSLMQRTDKAAESIALAQAARANRTEESAKADERAKLQYQLGQRMSVNFMRVMRESQGKADQSQSVEDRHASLVTELLEGLEDADGAGVPRELIDRMAHQLADLFDSSKVKLVPPRDVPEGLSAQEYYDLGIQYKNAGWTEQARDALNYSFGLDPEGIGKRARDYLRIRIPHHPVPLIAQQKNVKGFNQMFTGDFAAAKQTFTELIRDYPTFEWPYGNLGSIQIMDGDLDLATGTLQTALDINPYYVSARLHLCRAQLLLSDFDGARQSLDAVKNINSDERFVDVLQKHLEFLAEGNDSSAP